jgi:hypothetical protein
MAICDLFESAFSERRAVRQNNNESVVGGAASFYVS